MGDSRAGGEPNGFVDSDPRADINGEFNRFNNVSAADFDIFQWHPAYKRCQRHFIEVAQYDTSVQAVAALINIALPFQWPQNAINGGSNKSTNVYSASTQQPARPFVNQQTPQCSQSQNNTDQEQWVSLIPYIRRLVVTGFDRGPVLHGFFGEDWRIAIAPLQECERRNYLFAAKSGGWLKVKTDYDMGAHETVPFLQPPRDLKAEEIDNANKLWSEWLFLEDWMVRAYLPAMRAVHPLR